MKFETIESDLIQEALNGRFDVITHGCNTFNTMSAGIAVQMVKYFRTDLYPLEQTLTDTGKDTGLKGNINKLGQIEYEDFFVGYDKGLRDQTPRALNYKRYSYPSRKEGGLKDDWVMIKDQLFVVNAYTQYRYGKNHPDGVYAPLDYEALTLCMRKINHTFKGQHVGLPYLIGCGLAGGKEEKVLQILKRELKDCDVTLVKLKK
jgi:O-acetyl-ADP-ribose deacetylase (regulator of RNase III)